MKEVIIDGEQLTLRDVFNVAYKDAEVIISEQASQKIAESRKQIDELLEAGEVVYGVTTGFGKFSDVVISPKQAAELQLNLIRSHACGVGKPLTIPETRAVMLLRANALAKGYSGIRSETLKLLVDMLNHRVHPLIPEQGSLGASGDLAPLAHMALVMVGEGEAEYKGAHVSGKEALALAGLRPVTLAAKEGLALINGTQVMAALGTLLTLSAENLAKSCDIISALSFETLRGIPAAFDPRIGMVRPHPGQQYVAANLTRLIADSQLTTNAGTFRTQDAYALRCIPQVHGATRDTLAFVHAVLSREINAATDNPLIFTNSKPTVLSGGNFHGQPIALAADFLGIAVAELGSISERRIERLMNPHLSGLPAFLTKQGGLNSGLMITHYTAASLVSENKVLAHPASVDSIPTSANQEDHVSMGMTAVRKAGTIISNVYRVLAVEWLASCQAADLLGPERLGKGSRAAHKLLRTRIPALTEDRSLSSEIELAAGMLRAGLLVQEIEGKIGELY